MKAVKYLFPLWAGVLIYALLTVAFGAMGFSAYNQLDTEREKQEANLENLKLVNRELENSMNSLLYDKDTLAVYARGQGYASPRERFIRIVGLGSSQTSRNSAGDVTAAADPQYVPDKILIIIACFSGLAIFICLAVFDVMKFLREA